MIDLQKPLNPIALREAILFVPILPRLYGNQTILKQYWHWSVSDYETTFPDYNICVPRDEEGEFIIKMTQDVRHNAIDINEAAAYAAHTAGRNSHAVGISASCMVGATPSDFGECPPTEEQIEVMLAASAATGMVYAIDVSNANLTMTHAEAAILDRYFPGDPVVTGYPESGPPYRWDWARTIGSEEDLNKEEARETGTLFRARAHQYKLALIGEFNRK